MSETETTREGLMQELQALKQQVSAMRQMENKIYEAELRYRTLFEQSSDGILVIDTNGKFIEFNDAAHLMLGYTREEFKALSVPDINTDSIEKIQACIGRLLQDGKATFEVKYKAKDGSVRDIRVFSRVLVISGQRLFHSIWKDITEQKKTEEGLHRSQEFIKNILDTVDEGFIVIDQDYRIISANNAYYKLTNLRAEDVFTKHCYEVSHRRQSPCYEDGEECAVRRSFETGEPHSCVHRHVDGEGSSIFVETKSYPLRDASGAITSVIEVINNVTEKQLLEEQLLRNQKLEAVGLLAGGIAHDFNNLLQGVFGNISLARQLSVKDGTIHQLLNDAERALNLSRNLTHQLLTFSKGGEPVKSVMALEHLMQDSVKFALSGSKVDFQFSLDKALWLVEVDAGQISQVIQNIVLNASDAMEQRGTVRIGAQNVVHHKTGALPLDKGNYVKITIKDSGAGISADHLAKIFDPYFTTKQKGSGLGLATSYSIIKKHKGLLTVQSEPGVGSTFTIYLPAAACQSLPAKEPAQSLVRGKGKILFMDDDTIIRAVAGYMLTTLGYEADIVENGEQAVVKYADAVSSRKPYDAVILDMTVRGGMGGTDALDKIREIDPAVKAIVSSGYSDDPLTLRYHDYGFKAILPKPYELGELSRVLHALLNGNDV